MAKKLAINLVNVSKTEIVRMLKGMSESYNYIGHNPTWAHLEQQRKELKAKLLDTPEYSLITTNMARINRQHDRIGRSTKTTARALLRTILANGLTPALIKQVQKFVTDVNRKELKELVDAIS